jgi:hypothetical protein
MAQASLMAEREKMGDGRFSLPVLMISGSGHHYPPLGKRLDAVVSVELALSGHCDRVNRQFWL